MERAVSTLMRPDKWCRAYGLALVGAPPRGWRDADAPGWEVPISLVDFYRRAARSGLHEDYSPGGWRALMDAAHTAEDYARGAGTDWTVLLDDGQGALYADGQQVRLPGPVISLVPHIAPIELRSFADESPAFIQARPAPYHAIEIRLAPHPLDTCTLVEGSRVTHVAGTFETRCPTCGNRKEPS